MIAALKLVPVWAWAVLGLIVALALAAGYQTLQLSSVRTEYAEYRADIDFKARQASDKAREIEQQRQRDIDQVRNDATAQKQKDDAHAAELLATGDSLRKQTSQLLADKATLRARLAERGQTIEGLADLLAQLRTEADDYAGGLAAALDSSRRAGFACESSYQALTK